MILASVASHLIMPARAHAWSPSKNPWIPAGLSAQYIYNVYILSLRIFNEYSVNYKSFMYTQIYDVYLVMLAFDLSGLCSFNQQLTIQQIQTKNL